MTQEESVGAEGSQAEEPVQLEEAADESAKETSESGEAGDTPETSDASKTVAEPEVS